jgi:hypothetical protein
VGDKTIMLLCGFLGFAAICFGEARAAAVANDGAQTEGIQLPADGGDYAMLVARAAMHDQTVDFHALRAAYVKSPTYPGPFGPPPAAAQLTKDMVAATAPGGDPGVVRQKAEAILSLDYTDMIAHKMRRQACALLHDDACAEQSRFIEFGLLNSVVHPGDGQTCANGWVVMSVHEEYEVLALIGMRPGRQSLVNDGAHACDKMDVTDAQNGMAHTYYFNVDAALAAEQSLFTPKTK